MSFAATLSKRVASKRQESKDRELIAEKWVKYESKLLDVAVNLLKQRVLRIADNNSSSTAVSFEVLSRSIPNFPTYTATNGTYLLDSWGEADPSWWYYAHRGTAEVWTPGVPVQFAELLEGLMPKFVKRVKSLGFESCAREPNSWRVRVAWNTPPKGSSASDIDVETFADECTQRMAEKLVEVKDREQLAAKWVFHRDKLLDEAVELFKQRCIRAAMNMQCQAVISFEVLTREIQNFPSYSVKESTYFVDSWGDAAASWWFYDSRGTQEAWQAGTPVQFAEVLEGMMSKFVEKVAALGFQTCSREPSSWRVRVTWKAPEAVDARSSSEEVKEEVKEKAPRKKRKARSPSPPPPPPSEPSPAATAPVDEDEERVATEEAGSPASAPPSPKKPKPAAKLDEEDEEKVDTEEAGSPSPDAPPVLAKPRKGSPAEEPPKKKTRGSRSPSQTEVPSATECASSDGEGGRRGGKRRSATRSP